MPFPMLPNDGQNPIGNPNNVTGEWVGNNNGNFLAQLVSMLPNGADGGTVDSVPDVWAKPLLFKMALYNNGGVKSFAANLHRRVVGEWRAILAMLALQKFRALNFSLSARNINLNADNSELAEIFKSLVPRESFDGKKNAWLTGIYVIYYQQNSYDDPKPLALTSPLTLVAPAADYSNDLAEKLTLPWSKDGRTLTDPTNFITEEECRALLGWLNELADSIPASQNNLAHNLSGCIEKFISDVKARLPKIHHGSDVNFGTSDLQLDKGFSALLNFVALPPEGSHQTSPFELKVNPARTSKKIILISPEMARDFAEAARMDPAQLSVWQGVYAADITSEFLKSAAHKKFSETFMASFEFRQPEDFFHDRIAVFDKPDTFYHDVNIRGTGGIPYDFVLPIKRALLECFSPEEISQRISFKTQRNSDIVMMFKFPLQGINGVKDFIFTKVYTQALQENSPCGIYLELQIPQIALWPNMRRAGWHEYYLYYENYAALNSSNIPANKMYYVEPWGLEDLGAEDYPAQGVKNRLIERLNAFPEALIFNYYVDGAAQEIGALLLNLPEEIPQDNSAWNVGVDFGTSSTMLYYQANGGAYQPLIFKPHLLKITKPESFMPLDTNFMASIEPKKDANGSFLSVFYSRVNNQEIRLIRDGHILNFINPKTFKELGAGVKTNLKWSADPEVVKAYVEQICLQILVEAAFNHVSNIDWNFSYPTAFAHEYINAFRNTCEKSVENAYTQTGFAAAVSVPEMWAESKASAYHFRSFKGDFNFGAGALCVDIGAGTTDITVISGSPDKIVYHTSVRYAGESLFSPIYKRYDIFAPDFASTIQNVRGRQALIDEDLRHNSGQYITNLNTLTVKPKTSDAVKKVLQCSQFAAAGLFYYLGKILKMLHAKNIFVKNALPPVFIGGNGSRIFDWLTCGAANINNPFTDVLKKMLEVSSGLTQKWMVFYRNPQPKSEVASGMLSVGAVAPDFFSQDDINEAVYGTADLPYDMVLAGAEFSKDGKPRDGLDFISAQDIVDGIEVNNLDELKKFIDAFNDFRPRSWLWSSGIRFGDNSPNQNQNAIFFSDMQISQLEQEILNSYAQWIGFRDVNAISPEPVFIVELRNLIKLLAV